MLRRFDTHDLIASLIAPLSLCAIALGIGAIATGCNQDKDKKPHQPIALKPLYPILPPKVVPAVFKDSVLERCDLVNSDPFLVSGYGLVVNLDSTGDSHAPNLVRQYILDMMIKHKVGSSLTGVKTPPAETMLRDPRVAIVQVDGYLPPGVRKGQPFDVQVSAIPESNTTSLAGGDLLETELRITGANPNDPGGAVNVFGRSAGNVFVNPAYALDPKASQDPAARRSLRFGVVMDGARSLEDRSLGLRLRSPSLRLSRYIEDRIDSRFQEMKPDTIAAAQDEGIVSIWVPADYVGDWEHFAGVVQHLFFNASPEFATHKAKQLAEEAVKPDAPLMDISFAWEGLGKASLPVIHERNLMSSPNQDIAYAAARAAAFLGDSAAPQALVDIARTPGHKFQINAIHILGEIAKSPALNEMLRPLMDSDESLVRLEAYRMLVRNGDNSVFSTPLKSGFTLDVVRSTSTPLIYATRRGEARLAIIGNHTQLHLPILFTAMDGRLSISSDESNKVVTIFYRPAPPPGGVQTVRTAEQMEPIKIYSAPDLAEIVARLGGEGTGEGVDSRHALNFNYGQIVSIVNNLISQQQIAGVAGGKTTPASFVLQELPASQETIYNAPVIADHGRPQSDEPRKVGLAN